MRGEGLRREKFGVVGGTSGAWRGRRPGRRAEGGFKTVPLSVRNVLSEYQGDGRNGWANWEYHRWLCSWAKKFIKAYELKTREGRHLKLPVIKIAPLNVKTIVGYREKRDGLGFAGTLEVNEKRLHVEAEETLLAHLLKGLMRAWQRERCADEVFDRESRESFRKAGLVVTEGGKRIRIEEGGSFQELLKESGIKTGSTEGGVTLPEGGSRSTLKLWTCYCQRARVGTGSFVARCEVCNQAFRLGDHIGEGPVPGGDAERAVS